jgi:dTMP kinase
MIVAFEGIDASGKETQVALLAEEARKRGLEVQVLSFPAYDTPTGQLIKDLLKENTDLRAKARGLTRLVDGVVQPFKTRWVSVTQEEHALALQALMLANRHEFYSILSAHKSAPDSLLILDRYYGSGLVYGSVDGLSDEFLNEIHLSLPRPDLWVYVDISPEESFRRRLVRDDKYESDFNFLKKVRKRYAEWVVATNGKEDPSIFTVNGQQSVEDVRAEILNVIDTWLQSS